MIKNIIFDLGGILIELFPQRTFDAFGKLEFKDPKKSERYFRENKTFERLDTTPDSRPFLVDEINAQLKQAVKPDAVLDAWNLLLGKFKPESVELARKANNKFRCFLLSNTNNIHYEKYAPDFKSQFGFELSQMFEKAYFSHLIALRKPMPEIFELVLNENGLKPAETLFIDDNKDNRETARKLGIRCIDFEMNDDISKNEELLKVIDG